MGVRGEEFLRRGNAWFGRKADVRSVGAKSLFMTVTVAARWELRLGTIPTEIEPPRAAIPGRLNEPFEQALIGRPAVPLIDAGRRMVTKERIVAVGLLTQRDLDVLGTGFHRRFPIEADENDDGGFAELITQLDKIDTITADPDASRCVKLHLNRSGG